MSASQFKGRCRDSALNTDRQQSDRNTKVGLIMSSAPIKKLAHLCHVQHRSIVANPMQDPLYVYAMTSKVNDDQCIYRPLQKLNELVESCHHVISTCIQACPINLVIACLNSHASPDFLGIPTGIRQLTVINIFVMLVGKWKKHIDTVLTEISWVMPKQCQRGANVFNSFVATIS